MDRVGETCLASAMVCVLVPALFGNVRYTFSDLYTFSDVGDDRGLSLAQKVTFFNAWMAKFGPSSVVEDCILCLGPKVGEIGSISKFFQ